MWPRPYMPYLYQYGMVCTHMSYMYPYVGVCTQCPFCPPLDSRVSDLPHMSDRPGRYQVFT